MVANFRLSQVTGLRKQIDEYREILDLPLENPSTVYVGDGYFVTMTQAEAKEFLRRKLQRAEHELKSLSRLGTINEEGLPILDIIEELDEEGEIISSEVKPAGFGSFPAEDQAFLKSTKRIELTNGDISKVSEVSDTNHEINFEKQAGLASSEAVDDPNVKLAQNTRDFDNSDDEVQYIENVADTESIAEDGSNGEFRDIHPLDVLELELFGEDINESDDEKMVNFDFDDVEEYYGEDSQSSDSDDSSNMYDWRGGSLFPTDVATQRRIRAHLAPTSLPSLQTKDRLEQLQEGDHTRRNKEAHVHFANNVDVREFETTSAERKFTPMTSPQSRVSRFKAARQAVQEKSLKFASSRQNSIRSSPQQGISPPRNVNAPSAALAAAAAVTRNSPSSEIHRPVTERNQSSSRPMASGSPARKPSTQELSLKGAACTRNSQSQNLDSTTRQAVNRSSSLGNSDVLEAPHPHSHTDSDIDSKAESDRADSVHQELAPKVGLKNKVAQDAKQIFENSFIPDDEFLRLHSVTNNSLADNVASAVAGIDLEDDSHLQDSAPKDPMPILSSVIERSIDDESEDESDCDEDNVVNMTEIKQEYQRLRQKLIYESGGFKVQDSEKAVEPIDPDGTAKKISRFKAARVA